MSFLGVVQNLATKDGNKAMYKLKKNTHKKTTTKIKFPFKRKACQVYEGGCCRQVNTAVSLVVW